MTQQDKQLKIYKDALLHIANTEPEAWDIEYGDGSVGGCTCGTCVDMIKTAERALRKAKEAGE